MRFWTLQEKYEIRKHRDGVHVSNYCSRRRQIRPHIAVKLVVKLVVNIVRGGDYRGGVIGWEIVGELGNRFKYSKLQ